MMPLSNEEFASEVLRLARPAAEFRPCAAYDPDGDCIEFLARPDPFYAVRVDELLTVYYSQETKEIVGSLIKGVSRFCQSVLQRLPGFRIEIRDGRVGLVHIFRASLWSRKLDPQALPTVTYQKLIAMAEQAHVEAELTCV